MKFRAVHLACVWLLLGGRAGAALSSWDESQLGLLEQYPTPLRWDNVEGAPQWVAGAKPDHNLRRGLHLIHLHPGEEVTLRAAADTWLRLAGEGRTLRLEDLEISVSTDTRMFLEVVPLKTIDPYSLLIALPRDKPSLIRITLPPQRASNCVFAAFFSRREFWPALAPHRGSLRLPGKEVRVQRDDESFSHGACPLNTGENLTLTLEGPTRLQLEAILQWPLNDPTRENPLILQAGLEGGDLFPLLLGSRFDNRHRTRVEGTNVLVSRRMEGFLNIPAGEHRLRLRTTAPIYLSVFQQDHPDFLLPRINGPATNALQLLHQALGNSLAPDSNLVSPLRSPAPFQEPPFSGSAKALAAFEQEAWRLARDNQPLDAGAQAADWLDRLSQTRPDYPAARQTAESLWSLRTFYREILPSSMAPGQPLRKAFFSPRRILPTSESGRRVAVHNPTLEETMGLFAEGHFVPVPPEFPPGLLYELPARFHDSRLRIAGIGSSATRTRVLVQLDQEAPLRVDLVPEKTLPAGELEPADAFATLRVLEQAAQLPTNASLGPPVGEFDLPLSVSEPGVAEFPLPRHVRRVRVQLPPGAAPVLVSVAYRAAEPFQLGEAGFLELLAQVDSLEVMRFLAQPGNLLKITKSPFALDQLRNHLVPLSRLLNAHVNDFTRSVDLVPGGQVLISYSPRKKLGG